MCPLFTVLATVADQPFPVVEMGISDFSQVFAGCRSTHADVSKPLRCPTAGSTAQTSASPAGSSSTAPGRTVLPAQGEQAHLLSGAQRSTVVAVAPNHCPGAQTPPGKPLSLIWIKFLISAKDVMR